MRFDHLIHLVPDLQRACSEYEKLGFRPQMGGEHPGRGTNNAAVRSGSAYIELLGVQDQVIFWKHEEERIHRYPRLALRTREILEQGGGVSGLAVEVDDISATVARLRAVGLPVAQPTLGRILRPDGSQAEWGMAGLTEGPSWLPFFIQYATPGRGHPQVLPWVMDHVLIETADPSGGARLLGQMMGLPVTETTPDQFIIPLGGCAVQLTRGTAERVAAVVFSQSTDPVGEVCGLRFEHV